MQVSWLTETDLMALLLERLGPGFPPDAQKHGAEILAAVARSQVTCTRRVNYVNTVTAHQIAPSGADLRK